MNLSILLAFFGATTSNAAPDPTLLRNFDTFARYATAAYCKDLTDVSVGTKVCNNPQPGACGDLADATTVTEFGTSKHAISGNIAVSNSQKLIVLSFRGTDIFSFRDVLTDLKFCPREPRTAGKWIIKALCGILPSYVDKSSQTLLHYQQDGVANKVSIELPQTRMTNCSPSVRTALFTQDSGLHSAV